jgi:hypothetical protein
MFSDQFMAKLVEPVETPTPNLMVALGEVVVFVVDVQFDRVMVTKLRRQT